MLLNYMQQNDWPRALNLACSVNCIVACRSRRMMVARPTLTLNLITMMQRQMSSNPSSVVQNVKMLRPKPLDKRQGQVVMKGSMSMPEMRVRATPPPPPTPHPPHTLLSSPIVHAQRGVMDC